MRKNDIHIALILLKLALKIPLSDAGKKRLQKYADSLPENETFVNLLSNPIVLTPEEFRYVFRPGPVDPRDVPKKEMWEAIDAMLDWTDRKLIVPEKIDSPVLKREPVQKRIMVIYQSIVKKFLK